MNQMMRLGGRLFNAADSTASTARPAPSSVLEARCSALEAENSDLKARCAALAAENARLQSELAARTVQSEQAAEATSSDADAVWQGQLWETLVQSPLNLSGAPESSTNFSTKGHLFTPPFHLNEIVALNPDQRQLAAQVECSRRRTSAFECVPKLACITREALESFSASHSFAIGLGVYQRVSVDDESHAASSMHALSVGTYHHKHRGATGGHRRASCSDQLQADHHHQRHHLQHHVHPLHRHSSLQALPPSARAGGFDALSVSGFYASPDIAFKVGPLVFFNNLMLRMNDDDEEVALDRLMHTVDHHDAFRRALQGLLKNALRGDADPVAVRRLYRLHTSPSVMSMTFLYPCSYYDGGKLHELAYLMVSVPQTIGKGLMENLMQDHIALKFVPAMMTTVDMSGQVIAQNSASFGGMGFLGRDHRRLGPEQRSVHYLQELFSSKQDAYQDMLDTTARGFGSTFKVMLEITSPTLLHWLGKVGQEVWHEVQVSIMPHPVYVDHVFIVSQSDVTATVVAQRQVELWQHLQRDLLSEILPPQVADKLLHQSSRVAEEMADILADEACYSSSLSPPHDVHVVSPSPSSAGKTYSQSDSDEELIGLSRRDVMSLATYHEQVTILFTDIVGFTALSQQLHPSDVMVMLNQLFSIYDSLCEVHDVYKVETIGDSFMAAGGLFAPREQGGGSHKQLGGHDPHHAEKIISFARALVAATERIRTPQGGPLTVRVGVHSGPCMSGVVGLKMPRFCLFGDTINMASRMESTGQPGTIHVSQATRDLLPNEPWQSTGGVFAKGKGEVQTFILAHSGDTPASSLGSVVGISGGGGGRVSKPGSSSLLKFTPLCSSNEPMPQTL